MRLLLVGPPGSGKGTQAKLLCDWLSLCHLSTGDLLREAIQNQTPAGTLAQPYVTGGQLVPDRIVNEMVAERFRREDRPSRFIMDGYPRTQSQAQSFDKLLAGFSLDLQNVIELVVDDEKLVQRLSNRRICSNPDCQRLYHLVVQPPAVENICDKCGAALIQRSDDNERTIRERLTIYHQTSQELLDHYRRQGKLHQICADKAINQVYAAIQEILKPAELV